MKLHVTSLNRTTHPSCDSTLRKKASSSAKEHEELKTKMKIFDSIRNCWKGYLKTKPAPESSSVQQCTSCSLLLLLPGELIFHILEYVDKKEDQRQVCLTGKELCAFMRPIMYRNIVFGACKDYCDSQTSRLKILILYDVLSNNQELASRVRRLELPYQEGNITEKDVRTVARRAIKLGIRHKADVNKAWRRRVLRQFQMYHWTTGLTRANGMPKDAVFQFWALAASMLLLKIPKLERLELDQHMYTRAPLFYRLPNNSTHLLPLALPRLTQIDLPLHKIDDFAEMTQHIEECVPRVQIWSYTYMVNVLDNYILGKVYSQSC